MAFARSRALRSGGQRLAAAVRIILIMLLAVGEVYFIQSVFLAPLYSEELPYIL